MGSSSEVEEWIEIAKECKYLPENDLKVKAIPTRIYMGAAGTDYCWENLVDLSGFVFCIVHSECGTEWNGSVDPFYFIFLFFFSFRPETL